MRQQRFVARFTAAKERARMKEMKSKRGLHMNLEHLDSECLFLGTVYNLLVYNLTSISCLKCHNQILFLKKWKFKV